MLRQTQTFRLPFPPSVNQLYSNASGIGRVKTKAYRSWENEAGLRLNLARPAPIKGPFTIEIQAKRPNARRRDLGNLEKAVSDLLVKHGVIEDDSLMERLVMEWSEEVESGILVTLVPVGRT